MLADVMNNLGACPDRCEDADITVDWDEVKGVDLQCCGVRAIIDCTHSGVCAKRAAAGSGGMRYGFPRCNKR